MEGSPDQNINEDGGYKSGDLSDGETPATKASEIDEKLEEVAKIKMFTRLKEDIFQLSVRGNIPVQRRSNMKEIEEKATMEMNVKETAFGKYDLYVFTVTFTLVNGWQLYFIMLHLSYNHYII